MVANCLSDCIADLLRSVARCTSHNMSPPIIFDRRARRLRRNRMLSFANDDRWMIARMASEVRERLDCIKRDFNNALIVGSDFGLLQSAFTSSSMTFTVADPGSRVALACQGVQCDEDRIKFEKGAFDLVIAIGTLDSVDDLPGALIQIRRALAPDGLFLGAMMGAGGLALTKSIFADVIPGSAHIHPQIDVRATGDLLARAGFTMPVADSEDVVVRYSSFARLIADLRANGQTNVLASRRRLRRDERDQVTAQFDASDRQETISFLYMTGWAPPAK
jgi:NADH dehydrogenase [ubiquinone] 1 alpha subcomplex assembly factor 5